MVPCCELFEKGQLPDFLGRNSLPSPNCAHRTNLAQLLSSCIFQKINYKSQKEHNLRIAIVVEFGNCGRRIMWYILRQLVWPRVLQLVALNNLKPEFLLRYLEKYQKENIFSHISIKLKRKKVLEMGQVVKPCYDYTKVVSSGYLEHDEHKLLHSSSVPKTY